MRVFHAANQRIPETEDWLAEGVGFEPTSGFRRCRFSRPGSRVSTCMGLGMCPGGLQSPRSTSPAIPGNGPQRPQARTDDAWAQTVVQGRRPAHPIRLFPNAITASVNPGNSAASFSATAAPGGTSTSARPSTTAAITAHVTHCGGIAIMLSGSPGFWLLLSRTIGVSMIPGIINDAVMPLP